MSNVLPSLHALSVSTGGGMRAAHRRPKKPTLIITLGPTGAGKATLMNQAIKELGVRKFERVLVDDLVENDAAYKRAILDLVLTHKFPDGMKESLLNPSNELMKAFSDAYFAARQGASKLDKANDATLDAAFKATKNIVFEMTGTYYPRWLIDMAQEKGYRIVAAYSIVNFCDLVKRNTNRAVSAMRTYLDDTKTNPAPRLPNVLDDTNNNSYRTAVQSIKKVLLDLVDSCATGKGNDFCGVDRVMVFDNNQPSMKLLLNLEPGGYSDAEGKFLKIGTVEAMIEESFVLRDGGCTK